MRLLQVGVLLISQLSGEEDLPSNIMRGKNLDILLMTSENSSQCLLHTRKSDPDVFRCIEEALTEPSEFGIRVPFFLINKVEGEIEGDKKGFEDISIHLILLGAREILRLLAFGVVRDLFELKLDESCQPYLYSSSF